MEHETEIIGKEVVKYQLLDELTQQEGWPILLEQLENLKQADILDLLGEKDYNKIVTLQSEIKAYSSVIKILKTAKLIKEKLFHDIQLILEDEKIKSEYDL